VGSSSSQSSVEVTGRAVVVGEGRVLNVGMGVAGETSETVEEEAQVALPAVGRPAPVEQIPASTKFWSQAPASNSL